MKEHIISFCLLILAALTIYLISRNLPSKNYANLTSSAPPTVAEDVIRLHILADSDSERDQAIKHALRDMLLPYLNAVTLKATDKASALDRLTDSCQFLTGIANQFLESQNAGYTARISVEHIWFPIRIYGSETYLSEHAVLFPPGFYDSVQVVLGRGEGHNWWCLAYPSLCFIDSSYDYVPKDLNIYKRKIGSLPKASLEKLFYGETVSKAFSKSDQPADDSDEITVYFCFKLWELIKNKCTGAE